MRTDRVEPRVKPSRDGIARAIWDCTDLNRAVLEDCEEIADAVLALWPGKTEQEVREEIAAEIKAYVVKPCQPYCLLGKEDRPWNLAIDHAARIARGGAR